MWAEWPGLVMAYWTSASDEVKGPRDTYSGHPGDASIWGHGSGDTGSREHRHVEMMIQGHGGMGT